MDVLTPTAEPPAATPAGDAGTHAAQHSRLRRVLFSQRGVVVKLHRWLSFALLAWILLESVTGAVLVFDHEIDRWWNRSHFETSEGDVGADRAIAAARVARPGEPIRYVFAPGADDSPSYEVGTAAPDGEAHVVLVDPGSGRVTADDHHPPVLMEYLLDLHVDLNSTSVFGIEATHAVAWLGVGWLIVLVSGFYVWYWPRVKRWARALRVRRKRGRFAFHLDLHNAIGIATILPMTLIVLTGIDFVFRDQVASVYEVVTFGAYEERDTTVALSQPNGATPISTGDATGIVSDLDPAIDVAYVYTPAGSPTGTYSVYAYVDGSFFGMVGGEHEVEFDVDQYSGRILRIDDPLDGNGPSQAFDDWSYPVHTGSFGGTITRWLWFLIGLTPFALAWTGVVMWLVRRQRRLRARAKSEPEPAGALDLDPTLEHAE